MNRETKERLSKLFEGVENSLHVTDPEWVDIVANFSQNETVIESKLTEKEQALCILSALLAIKEVIYQATAYLGIGRTYDYLMAANRIMEQHDIELPLASQATTSNTTRFRDGLAKQIDLFGPGMAKVQTDGPALRRNINRWLADNCFGDYYTRAGLNDQEREMITFCFILAQGGCENQLRGHTAGNFGVGNDKEKLYSVVEQCMPYIGYPRALNAMNIIDEVVEKMESQQA